MAWFMAHSVADMGQIPPDYNMRCHETRPGDIGLEQRWEKTRVDYISLQIYDGIK